MLHPPRRLAASAPTRVVWPVLPAILAPLAGAVGTTLLLWQRIGFSPRPPHQTADDELKRLASALDEMTARLDATSRELAARNAERELDERRRAALLRVAQALAEQDDPRRIVEAVEIEAAEALGADAALVALWDQERGSLWPTHEASPPLTEWRHSLSRPLLHEGRLLGTISVGRLDADRPFTAEDGEFMELLASLGAAHLVGHERTRLAGVVLAARTAQHELNNRLTRVVGYAELLTCEPDLPPDARRMVELVLDGANDVAGIVTRMGSVAKLEEVDWGGDVGSTIDLERSLAR
jgi:signal transduction histidine kinase